MSPNACRSAWISSLSLALALGGCNSTGGGCPPLVTYTRQAQQRAARELLALPSDSALATLIVDYSKMRDACRVAGP